jgi:hypothetical protein
MLATALPYPYPSVDERDIFGIEGVIYPGHPVCIAYLIMLNFPSLEAAKYRPPSNDPHNQKSPRALVHENIPGGGGNVFGALDVLKRAREASPEVAFEFGAGWWMRHASGTNYPDRREPGQAQADNIKAAFLEKAAEWITNTTPPVTAMPLPASHPRMNLIGKEVEWTSQSGGHTKHKSGKIVRQVPAGSRPSERLYPDLYRGAGPGLPRNEVSYVVAVELEKNKVKHYWPRVGQLQIVID